MLSDSLTVFSDRQHPIKAAIRIRSAIILNESSDFNVSSDRSGNSQRLRGLLAIETGGRSGSIAWHVSGLPPRLVRLDPAQRSAVTLASAIADVIAQSRHDGIPIDCVAVNVGPGSFTGIRIGVTTAKTLAYALGCRLIAVDALAVAAGVLFDQQPAVATACVALNAYRQQLFVATWQRNQWQNAFQDNSHAAADEVWPAERWHNLAAITTDTSVCFAAEPSVTRRSGDTDCASSSCQSIDGNVPTLEITAEDVAPFAWRLARHAHFIQPMNCNPNYLRDSAAEEKLR